MQVLYVLDIIIYNEICQMKKNQFDKAKRVKFRLKSNEIILEINLRKENRQKAKLIFCFNKTPIWLRCIG